MGERSGDITRLLQRWSSGETGVFEELAPLVYDHLRSVAIGYLNREQSQLTLQATGLVHELFLRLLQQKKAEFQSRIHFYTFAARMMRRILVDAARTRNTTKRSAGDRIPLSPELAWIDPREPAMVDLDASLDALAGDYPENAKIIELRVFLGCTANEAADLMGVSKATADRQMRFALAWLYDRMQNHGLAEEG